VGDQLTLTTQDNTQFSVTITSGGGGDFVPIAGNEGNPMTGPLVMQRIDQSASNEAIAIGLNSNPNLITENTTIGEESGNVLATGARQNSFFGQYSGLACTTGIKNTAIGYGAMFNINEGSGNVCIGNYTGINFTTGNDNTMIGESAGSFDGSNQNRCIYIGKRSGRGNTSDDMIFIGSQNNDNDKSLIEGLSNGDATQMYLKVNGKLNVTDWQFKQVTAGLNIYFQGAFKARIGTDGDLYLAGTTTHYNATE